MGETLMQKSEGIWHGFSRLERNASILPAIYTHLSAYKTKC